VLVDGAAAELMLRLRVRLPGGQSTCEARTWEELAAHVDAALEEKGRSWLLLTGYPPSPMHARPANDALLSEHFRSGETVIVKLSDAPSAAAPAPVAPVAPTAPAPAALAAPAAPPSALPVQGAEEEDADLKLALALSLGQQPEMPQLAPSHDGEQLIRRVVPADNSCLFASLAHAFHGFAGRRERADELRRICADSILSDPIEYNEAMLGKAPNEYVQWILDPETWGGGIELSILSAWYRAEIAAFDVQTQRVDVFGQGMGHTQCVMLLYDGVHYDLAVRQLFQSASEELDVCVFSVGPEAEQAMAEARVLVAEANRKRAFTDTSAFTLRCLVCQKGLVGQEGALEHAKATGHTNFSEYR